MSIASSNLTGAIDSFSSAAVTWLSADRGGRSRPNRRILDQALAAEGHGIRILADVPELIPSFPDSVIAVPRSFLEKERGTLKRFIQAISEGIHELQTSRDKGISMLANRLKSRDRKTIEHNYDTYRQVFPLPPRVGKEGLRDVLEQIQLKSGALKTDPNLALFLNESVIDELEKEGFYKRLAQR